MGGWWMTWVCLRLFTECILVMNRGMGLALVMVILEGLSLGVVNMKVLAMVLLVLKGFNPLIMEFQRVSTMIQGWHCLVCGVDRRRSSRNFYKQLVCGVSYQIGEYIFNSNNFLFTTTSIKIVFQQQKHIENNPKGENVYGEWLSSVPPAYEAVGDMGVFQINNLVAFEITWNIEIVDIWFVKHGVILSFLMNPPTSCHVSS
jgi:hypothetical protein